MEQAPDPDRRSGVRPDRPGLARRGRPPHPGRRQPQRRHPPRARAGPGLPDIDLYLKDESTHPTGSLKHRLARSLFLYALCNGELHEGTTVIEASSGSTAVSRGLLRPHARAAVHRRHGRHHEPGEDRPHRARGRPVPPRRRRRRRSTTWRGGWPSERGGHYLDQFTYAERATDWRGNNNIAESIFEQMARERHPVPHWVVVGRGHRRHQRHDRPVRALPRAGQPGLRRRPGALGLPPGLLRRRRRGRRRVRVADRGHRPAAGGAELRPDRRRPDAARARRRVGRGDAVPHRAHRPARRRLDRHQPLRRAAARLRDGRARPGRRASSRCCATGRSGMPARTATTPGSPSAGGTSSRTAPCWTRAWDDGVWTG